ncbi:ATP/GTP-binding protein [Arthrobacter crystallopoietes BAB-32]|uniref:ATP/GTP-binding protein n=1 Tax=Arthrobacter crystallopoietes BAB-32 TaxID=1246476 RepID=N1V081_9MICC|nr:GTPase [Arthrobacter crystallopoietes]EMY33487.1 ATP/GTP-binding protein [Arthrobacter crystallopoietes BAB-32]
MSRHRSRMEGSPLQRRLEALNTARELAVGRLPEAMLTPAFEVLERASVRRSLSSEHTVVGLFGATGSGKSSLFNALTGQDIARAAARRPTTAEALAGVWGAAGSEPLLDWLQVNQRRSMEADTLADPASGGLILLDLPDFDSTALEHRQIVERMAGQVDVLVWVLDPQKYADAAVHNGFLRPLASHGAVTMIVLNQIDRLRQGELAPVLESLRAILARDGMDSVRLFPVSAATGSGIPELRQAIRKVADERGAANERLTVDVQQAASALQQAGGGPVLAAPGKEDKRRLAGQLAQAAGVEVVADAVEQSFRRRSHASTGWPVTRWLGRLRRDPLKRLNLDRQDVNPAVNRSSMPPPGPAQRAQADTAVRKFADTASTGAPELWRGAIRRAARSNADGLPDALDQALARTDLGSNRKAWWWPLVGLLQWIALAAALAGALWLLGLFVLGYLQLSVPPAPTVEGFPVPTLLLIAGLLLGILLGILSSVVSRVAAKGRAARARRKLQAAVADVAAVQVAQPVEAEIDHYNRFREAVAEASG